MMTDHIFSECEDPDIADLESELPFDNPEVLLGEAFDVDLSLEMDEFDEIGMLQEEMEATLLSDPMLAEGFEMDELGMEPSLLEEAEPIPLEEEGSANFDSIIAIIKNYPGLKITFSL